MAPNYQLSKGPLAVTMEQFLALRDNIVGLLGNLEAKDALSVNWFVRHLSDTMPGETNHLAEVVGTGEADNDAERKQRLLVYSEGLRLAIRLALDLGPNDRAEDVPREKKPHPVEILWGCGHQYNQAWVSTRPLADGGRLITIIFYSTAPATVLTRGLLKEHLVIENGTPDVRLDVQELVVCHGDRGDDGAGKGLNWFRPPRQMGIPPELT